MARHQYDRIIRRLSGIEERQQPQRQPVVIWRTLGEEVSLRAAALDPTGKRPVREVRWRGGNLCSIARAKVWRLRYPRLRRPSPSNERLAERDRSGNGFGALADRLEAEWLTLCKRFDLDYGRPNT
jgi:hypothetical protein